MHIDLVVPEQQQQQKRETNLSNQNLPHQALNLNLKTTKD